MVCMPSIQKISGHPVKPVPSRFRVRWRQLWVDVQTIVASSVMVIRYIHEANSFWSHGLVSTCGPHLLVIPQALFITSVRRDCLLVASRYLLRGSVYHLVIQHSHGKSPCLIGKPSISMGHLYHGYVSHNQRVNMLKRFRDVWRFSKKKTILQQYTWCHFMTTFRSPHQHRWPRLRVIKDCWLWLPSSHQFHCLLEHPHL